MLSFFSALMNRYAEQLSQNEKVIVKMLNDSAEEIPLSTITELSEKIFVSTSSLYRLIRKLGFKGYPEFKYKVADSLETKKNKLIDTNDYLQSFINEITFTHRINEEMIQKAATLILRSNKRLIFGTGWKQKQAADNFSSDMMIYGESFITLRTKEDLFSAIKYITNQDVLIFVSLSGNISSYDEVINFCDLNDIPIISVTRDDSNSLSSHSKVPLYYVDELPENSGQHWPAQTLNYLFELLLHVIKLKKE